MSWRALVWPPLLLAPVALALLVHHWQREGLVAGALDFAGALPSFRKVSARRDLLSKKLGGRFGGPIPAAIELRPSDVWIVTSPKSGTTWVTHIAHQLRTRGRPVDFRDQDDVVPWIEMLDTDFLNGTAFNRNPNGDHAAWPRVYKSHLAWDAIPAGPFKKVFVFREPADMLVSSAKFLPSLWGIVDPPSLPHLVSFFLWNGDLRSMLKDLVAVWRARHREDVLLLFYEDLLQDHARVVRRLARFMGIDADDALVDRVVNQTSHATMSAQHSVFANLAQARNMYKAQGLELDARKLVGKVRTSGGAAGAGRALPSSFDAALRHAWETHVAAPTGFGGLAEMRAAHAQEVVEPARSGGGPPPLVDVAPLWAGDGAARRRVGEELAGAAASWGVARLRGHGVDTDEMLDAARRYFLLPPAERGASFRNASIGFQRGYIPFAGESGLADVLEVKEGFLYGYDWENSSRSPWNALQGSNVWPAAHERTLGESWRPTLLSYYDHATGLARRVLEALHVALGLGDRDALVQLCEDGETISLMRMFNYLPRGHRPEVAPDRVRLGSSPHTDWYLLTVIVRDSSSRLQVAGPTPDAAWQDVPAADGELLVLFGDYLAARARGRVRSPVHRVLLPETGSSNSFVFLFSPAYGAPMLAPAGLKPRLPPGVTRVNTLLDAAADTAAVPFGDYIQRKRRQVMRK